MAEPAALAPLGLPSRRGPSSTLYGANALGGVIDLRQQSPLTAKAGSTFVAEGGSYGRASLGYAWATNNARAGQPAWSLPCSSKLTVQLPTM